jgi:hypothetical protein
MVQQTRKQRLPEYVILQPQKIGISLLVVGLLLIFLYRYIPHNIQIADLLILPLGPFFVFFGILFSLHNEPITFRSRVVVPTVSVIPWIRNSLEKQDELLSFFQEVFSAKQLPPEEDIPPKVRAAIGGIRSNDRLEYETLVDILNNPRERGEFLIEL